MKNKSDLKFIRDEVYKRHFWFGYGDLSGKKGLLRKILGESEESVESFLAHIATVSGTHYFEMIGHSRLVILWVKNPKNIPAIAHELTHLIHEGFLYLNIPMSEDNSEPLAYYMESCFAKCLDVINKPKNAKPNVQKKSSKSKNV